MGEWSNLTQREKSNIIRFAIKNGVSDINTIRDTFNVYAGGSGHIHEGTTSDSKLHIPTREEYITQKLDYIQNAALEASRRKTQAQTTPVYARDVYGQKYVTDVLLKGYVEDARNQVERLRAQERFRAKKNNSPEFIQGNTNTGYQSVRLAEAEKSLETAEKMLSGEIKYDGPTLNNCIANLSEFFPHGLPYGNETFSNNPKKYGFSLIDTWDVKPGDLVQKVDYSGRVPVPHHAMIYNGVDSNGEPTFNYSNGSMPYTIPNEFTGKVDTVGGYGVGKYYPDAVAKDKEHLWDVNVYRYTGTPQDSAQWTNEWLQKYGAGIEFAEGGKIHIKPSKIGTFTAAATKHGKSVQEFARQVLANKENYSPAMVRKAVFAHNSSKWHKHDGDSDTQYLRTEQPKVVMPVTGKTADTSWYEWWFANRQKQLQQNIETVKKNDRERDFTKYLISYPNSAEEDTERMIKALGETKEYVGNSGMMEDSIGNALARNLLKHQISDYTPDIPDYKVASYLSYLQDGVHLPAYNAILYPDIGESPSSTTVTHERAHAADAFFPRAAINYFTTSGEVNPERYDTWYKRIFAPLHPKYPLGIFPASGRKDYYLDDPNEVYSRLMEFRQFVGANPNYTWTKEDLKKYEMALEKYRLRRYSDDDLLKLLNEIAQNNSSFKKSDSTYLAAFGGKLKSTGGPLYPFSFSKNPYWKTPVVRYADGGHILKGGGFSIPLVLDKIQAEEDSLERQLEDLHIIKTTKSNIEDSKNQKFHNWAVEIAEANKKGIPYDIRPVSDFTNLYALAQKQDKYIDDAYESDYKYAIPYESDKIVKLSNGRKIPSNALDTLFKYSEDASIDPAILLGLAMKETTFGYTGPYRIAQGKENMQKLFNSEHDYFKSQGAITPSELLNYHNLWVNPYLGEWNTLVDKAGGEPKRYGASNYITPDARLYNFMADYLGTASFPIEASGVFNWQNDKLIKQRMPILDRKAQEKLSINPWKAAALLFVSGKYNPGDKAHTQSVMQLGKELMNDPVVKKVQEAKKWKK